MTVWYWHNDVKQWNRFESLGIILYIYILHKSAKTIKYGKLSLKKKNDVKQLNVYVQKNAFRTISHIICKINPKWIID